MKISISTFYPNYSDSKNNFNYDIYGTLTSENMLKFLAKIKMEVKLNEMRNLKVKIF